MTLNDQDAWEYIASSINQEKSYYLWCNTVIKAASSGEINIPEAAAMITHRADMSAFISLEKSADIQIIMEYSADIVDGALYVSSPPQRINKDWSRIAEIVKRHIEKTLV